MPDDVKRWYAEHGVEYIDSDWGPRSETGEGLSKEPALPREGRERASIRDERQLVQLEEQGRLRFPWLERQDNLYLEALEEFLVPYLARLPRAQLRVLDEWMFGRKSHREVGEALGMDHSNVTKRLRAASRRLVREIANDARSLAEVQGQDLDDEDDGAIAWRVFKSYMIQKGYGG